MNIEGETQGASQSTAGDIVAEWWRGLASDRGARADLRRCRTTLQVQLLWRFQYLAQRLPSESSTEWRSARLAAVAGVLAHVTEDAGAVTYAEILATPTAGGRSCLSDLRFRRLLATEESDELLTAFRRVVQVTDARAPVASLANDLLRWNDRTKKKWAAVFYRLAPQES